MHKRSFRQRGSMLLGFIIGLVVGLAIAVAVAAEGPEMRIKALAVVSEHPGPFTPCGACRQVIFEFGPEALVIFQGEDGLTQASITELLPHAFRLGK